MTLVVLVNGAIGIELDWEPFRREFLGHSMDTSENAPLRSLVLSIPGHQAKPILAAYAWSSQG